MENKKKVEDWANEVFKNTPHSNEIDKEFEDAFLEVAILGSLLYKEEPDGSLTRIKRLDRNTEFKVIPYDGE